MRLTRSVLAWVTGFCLAATAASAWSQISVGQTAGFTGPVAASVEETTAGAKLYFDAVNARGGVRGQAIQLISLDDKFEPALAKKNAKELIDKGVVALFLTRGTPHTQAILPLLNEFEIPLIGPSTGALVFHQPVQRWLFNVRSTYQHEAERAVAHLHLIGISRIAVIQVNDSFGDDAIVGVMRGLKSIDKQAVAYEKYDRTKPDFATLMPKVIAGNPQAVMFLGSGTAVVDGMKALRAAGSTAQMVTLSNNASAGFIKELGPLARGVVISQVFPYERSIASPVVREASDLARDHKIDLTPNMIEGFVAAKVLVEGLQRAGPRPTRQSLRAALESMSRYDAGGMVLGYSPTNHSGFDYADLAIVDRSGRFLR